MTKKSPKKNKKNKKRHQGQKAGQRRVESSVRLSLCMIARDEAQFLEQCLQSVKGLVDEVIVVDTGSLDTTAPVARRHGARVVDFDWNEDFSQARNVSLELARGEWILLLDCDEVLAAGDLATIRSLLTDPNMDAYYLTTRNYSEQENRAGWIACRGDYGEEKEYPGWFPSTKIRLWRRRPDVYFEGAVHELVEASIERNGGQIGECLVPVHHYGHVEKERSSERYLVAGEEKVRQQPNDMLARYELAIAYRNCGRLDEAQQQIKQVVEAIEHDGAEISQYLQAEFAYLVQADILDRRGQATASLTTYEAIINKYPQSYQAYNNAGRILERRGRLDQACAYYQQGHLLAPDNPVLKANWQRLQHADSPKIEGVSYRLSVCLIVRNEAGVLERCLQSVRAVADEIIVIDTGSVDQTVAMAREYDAKIGHFPWCDDFSAARNESLQLASGEWVLWMDADDYLLPVDQQKVAKLKAQKPDTAFYFLLNNHGYDRSSFLQIKMFPRRSDIFFERPVHETLQPALDRAHIAVRPANIAVQHTGYATQEAVQRKKSFYLGLMEAWLQHQPNDHYICFRIGHSYHTEGLYEKAKDYLERVIKTTAALSSVPIVRRLALIFYGRTLLIEGELEQALSYLEEAEALQASDVLTQLSLGDTYTKLGQPKRALVYLKAALNDRYEVQFPLDMTLIHYSAHFFIGQCYMALGQLTEARVAFNTAKSLAPDRPEAGKVLAQLGMGRTVGNTVGDNNKADNIETQRLSLCMIVRNEEARLGRCLESVQGLVDEIVVVDTGSTDRTVEIAQSFGAVIGHFSWCDDFSAARNESLKLASGEWIMWLDADDILPTQYHDEIRQLLSDNYQKSYFFLLDDQGYENVSCLQMRLFPNLPGIGFEMPIHEQMTPALARLGLEMIATEIRVVHTGYTTPEVVDEKKERYLRIMEDWLRTHPDDYIVRSHVALTYFSTDRLDEALEAYRHIVYHSPCLTDSNYVVYTTALLFLGRTYIKLQQYDKALEYVRKAEEVDPDYILVKISLAEVNGRLNDFAESLKYAEAVLAGGEQHTFFPIDQKEVRYSAHFIGGQAHRALNNLTAASEWLEQAAAIPVNRCSEAMGELSNICKEMGHVDKALEWLEKACKVAPEHLLHRFNMGVMQLEQHDLDKAKMHFKTVLEKEPEHAPTLLNLGFIAKYTGDLDKAERIYQGLADSNLEEVEGRANLGHLYLEQERYAEAVETFSQIRQYNTTLIDINLGLLWAQLAQGHWEASIAAEILAALAEIPCQLDDLMEQTRAAQTMLGVGMLLVDKGQIKCAELALNVTLRLEENLEARFAQGQVLMELGRFWNAIEQFEIVLMARPQDSDVFKKLGDCYSKLGSDEAAAMCYERAAQGEIREEVQS